MTIDPKALRSEGFIEAGMLIKRDAAAIVARWSQRAAHEQPKAARLHHRALLDHLPHFLDELGNSLIESNNGDVAHHCWPAMRHGEQRWDSGWWLTEVVRDYQILRLVLVDYLEETLHRPLRSREHQAIGLALDEAIAASVFAFVNIRTAQVLHVEKERAERAQETTDTLRRHAEQLQEAHRHKDEFLAVLSHELRNPLAPLRNALHVLSLNSSADTVKWARELMDRQVKVLARLVDDLLDVSRIARGKVALHREQLDLALLLRETAEDRRGSFAEAGLDLVVETPPEPVWVQGEPTRLAQVVGNLLHNAQKFTNQGGQVTVKLTLSGADQVTVAVRDTGIGVTPQTLDGIFEPFIQGDHETERRRGGLGLGLALVKALVELHGGKVKALSEGLGHGAQFQFTMPLAAASTTAPATPPAPVPAVPRRLRILLVEDNRDNADSTRALLELCGHQVSVARNGTEALALARQFAPEVVLCDLGLPDISGYDVAKSLRADPRTAATHLIALSGHSSDADRQRCQEAGFQRHLTKPVEPSVLQALIAGLGGTTP